MNCKCISWCRDYGAAVDEEHHRNCDKWSREIGTAYLTKTEIIVTGTPDDGDESHNCDSMGCSSISHVVFRRKLAPQLFKVDFDCYEGKIPYRRTFIMLADDIDEATDRAQKLAARHPVFGQRFKEVILRSASSQGGDCEVMPRTRSTKEST